MSDSNPANPFPLILPESLVLGQLVAALGSFIKATAWEIGERYDAVLSGIHGEDWLIQNYGDYRTPNLHDPDFVFDRHPPDSVLWDALPPFSPDLLERFTRARRTRNRWEHEAAKQNISTFLNGIDQIKRLAEPLGLQTRHYAPPLLHRTRLLQKVGGVLPPSDVELELERQKEAAEEAQRLAKEALATLMAAEAEAEAMSEKAAAAAAAKQEALVKAAQAEAEIKKLEAALNEAGRISRQAVAEPADDLRPGDPWGGIPLGIRMLTLKANMVDFLDQATQTLLSQQIGEVAVEAAQRWLTIMPRGGPVHLTEAGHAAGQVNGTFIYLGRLDTRVEH